ncbi:MAG: MYXO-CTERM sorting domain-containing protein [Sandaracinus sp.]
MNRTLVATLALVVLAWPATGRAQIFQPGTQPVGHPGGLVTPIQSTNPCRTCHAAYDDADDYEPWESWRGSLMASAGRDPIFRAALAIAEQDHPDAADFCVRCHSPGAWLRGRSEVPDYDPSATDPADRPRFEADRANRPPTDDLDGVGCMVCHRSTDPTDDQLFNARLVIADGAGNGDLRYGPYDYAPGTEAGHPTAVSTFLPTSRLCGQCHDITNPIAMGHRVEASGVTDTGRLFAIERTFSEWQASAFATRGQTCQSCHLPVVDHPVQVASFGSFPDTLRDGAVRHQLLGSAAWQLRAIAATIPDPAPGIALYLDANADRIDTFMRGAATVEIRQSALTGDTATATVRITNLTGHKLPTGYPEGRRMWLELDVVDADGNVVAGSARYDAATATLEMDPQARTYEARMGVRQADGTAAPGFHFVLADTLIEDTRIPPEGFAPAADDDDAPLGRDYRDGATGSYRAYDEPTYTLSSLCGTGTLTLRARLRFQATTREYIEFLRDHAPASLDPAMAGQSWGQVAYAAWMEHGGATPIEMASAEVVLGASPGACPEPVDAGVDAGTDAAMVADAGGGGGDSGLDAARADGSTEPPPASSQCGCRAVGAGRAPRLALLLVVLAAALARRRR